MKQEFGLYSIWQFQECASWFLIYFSLLLWSHRICFELSTLWHARSACRKNTSRIQRRYRQWSPNLMVQGKTQTCFWILKNFGINLFELAILAVISGCKYRRGKLKRSICFHGLRWGWWWLLAIGTFIFSSVSPLFAHYRFRFKDKIRIEVSMSFTLERIMSIDRLNA